MIPSLQRRARRFAHRHSFEAWLVCVDQEGRAGRPIICPPEYQPRWRRWRELRAEAEQKAGPMTPLLQTQFSMDPRRPIRQTTHTTGVTTGTFDRVLVFDLGKKQIIARTFCEQTITAGTLTLTMESEGGLVAGTA